MHRWLNSVAWILAAPGCDGGGHDSGPVSDLDVVELPVTPCTAPSEPGFDPISLGAGWGGSGWERDAESQYSGGGVVAADFNGDDVPDLFLAHVGPDELWLSEDGAWTRSVVPYHVDELTVGGVAADHDGDGDVDLYVVVLHGPNRLLENDGSGTFAEVEGADDGWHDSTGATFADVDADGDLDLLVSNHRETEALEQELLAREMTPAHPNGLYLNGSDGWEAGELPETWASGYTFVTAAEDLDGVKILCPRADIAPPAMVEALAAHGADVTEVTAYRTVPDGAGAERVTDMLGGNDVHWITFTSSSTVKNFFNVVAPDAVRASDVRLASIGPMTTATLAEAGFEPDIEADSHTIPGLVEAILVKEGSHPEKETR